MKNKILLLFILVAALVFCVDVKASSCGYEEQAKLNNEMGKIKVYYEIVREVDPNAKVPEVMQGTDAEKEFVAYVDTILIDILNITENMTVEVTNDYNKKTTKYTYKDVKDGVLSIKSPTIYEIVKYKITIKTSEKTGCVGETLRTIEYTQPRFNSYSNYSVCYDIPNFYLCNRYVTFKDDVTMDEFITETEKEVNKKYKEIEEYEKKLNRNWYEKTIDYIKEHKKIFIIGGTIIVVVVAAGTVLYIRKRRRDII